MQPLATVGSTRSTNTNLSTSLTLSVLDGSGNEQVIHTDPDHPIELIIPRDPNAIIPPMVMQNVTNPHIAPHRQLFNLHFSNITSILPVSVHFEMLSKTQLVATCSSTDSTQPLSSTARSSSSMAGLYFALPILTPSSSTISRHSATSRSSSACES